jgi:predicted GNAT family acetyltransferase
MNEAPLSSIARESHHSNVRSDSSNPLVQRDKYLPDIVQLGGIYTPPRLRGRGYARAAVAASLLEARRRGAERAVLFTATPNAERCYAAVGFRRVGDYALVLFADSRR